eukprot:3830159-Rhodomonas_salina.2
MTEFSNRGLEELVDVLRILLAGTPQWLTGIRTVLQQRRMQSWTHVLEVVSDALFGTSEQQGKSESLESEVEQVCRYSALLYRRVTAMRVHSSKKGWEFQCETSGRTVTEASALLALSDRALVRELILSRRAVLVPAEWWQQEQPSTPWGWWVLPVEDS